ncbi:VCBS repeat-containing protein [Haloferula sargassicola]|uniref:VCBS repeat-containing protein n=1 Tax=Haloferula sargassicola TaxID=490096 RepID=A0ABP9USD5_9BACT
MKRKLASPGNAHGPSGRRVALASLPILALWLIVAGCRPIIHEIVQEIAAGAGVKEEVILELFFGGTWTRAEVRTTAGATTGDLKVTYTGPPGEVSFTHSDIGYTTDHVIADFDNDGEKDDIAYTVDSTVDKVFVQVLHGNTFQLTQQIDLGTSYPSGIAAMNLNPDVDGHIDLVIACPTTNLSTTAGTYRVFSGNGDGTFSAGPVQDPIGGAPVDVALGFFNADPDPDLVIADGNASNMRLVVKPGGPGDSFGTSVSLASPIQPAEVRVVDFNPDVDDHDDIVSNGAIYLGDGSGGFPTVIPIGEGIRSEALDVGDLNGDGLPDVVLGSPQKDMGYVFFNGGGGTIDASATRRFPLNGSPLQVCIADLAGRGVADLLFTNAGGDPTRILGAGGGGFYWPQAVPMVANYAASNAAKSAAVADFTGDDLPDIAVANGGISDGTGSVWGNGTGVKILPGTGGGRFGAPVALNLPGDQIVAGDWDQDGDLDLAILAIGFNEMELVVALNDGSGGFPAAGVTTTGLGGSDGNDANLSTLRTGLVNADADPDLVIAHRGTGAVLVLTGDDAATFAAETPIAIGSKPSDLLLVDLNGDHKLDWVASVEGTRAVSSPPPDGAIAVRLGNGDGTFAAAPNVLSGVFPVGLVAADFNGDAKPDLATVTRTDAGSAWIIRLHEGLGTGGFAAPIIWDDEQTSVSRLVAMDADRDGKADLGISRAGQRLWLLRGQGDFTFTPFTTAGIGGSNLLATDLNLDGWPDLVCPSGKGYVTYFVNPIPGLGIKLPVLETARTGGHLLLSWSRFYPEYHLTETPDPAAGFSPSSRSATLSEDELSYDLPIDLTDPNEPRKNFFRLETEE